eukprot:GILK01002652.1.p1 GENE.GILK01002652.1~~GILK01002652.1.p1  ORF type:complete len:478 (-),score=100.25 GILK01002652.1:190-1623(-)
MASPSGVEKKQDWADKVEEEATEELEAKLQQVEVSETPEEDATTEVDEGPVQPKHASLLEDAASTVTVQQANANSPLYSVRTWEELNLAPALLDGIYAMNFTRPSKIQETALPLILRDPPENLIGQAHSGSGKTATFALAMLHRVDPNIRAPQAVCVCPTRELARQIADVVGKIGKYTQAQIGLVIPQADKNAKEAPITAQIVIGTPGRVASCLQKRLLNASRVKLLVLDEADEMLNMQGLGDATKKIRRSLPAQCQVLLFSATFADRVKTFAERLIPNANTIVVRKEDLTLSIIEQMVMDCTSEEHKKTLLGDLYSAMNVGQSIVFVNRRETAQDLTRRMRELGYTVSVLHGGDMETTMRDQVIDEFRKGTTKVLIATNVLARGIDIPQVTLVVNYDIPILMGESDRRDVHADPETYIHRIGRTGRFGKPGIAVNFVHDSLSRRLLKEIQDHYRCNIKPLAVDDYEELEKQLKSLQ